MVILVRRLEQPGVLVSSPDSHQFRCGYVQLEQGKEVGEHRTGGGEELIILMDGTAEVLCDVEAETVHAPAVVLVPPHTPHNIKNRSATPLRYLYVYGTVVN